MLRNYEMKFKRSPAMLKHLVNEIDTMFMFLKGQSTVSNFSS